MDQAHSQPLTDLLAPWKAAPQAAPPFHTDNRANFLAVSSRLMRQILVDSARNHSAAKRGADLRIELDALDDVARLDEQQRRIVEMRFFGALSSLEFAPVLDISVSTVKRDWNVANAWLTRPMKEGPRGDAGAMV